MCGPALVGGEGAVQLLYLQDRTAGPPSSSGSGIQCLPLRHTGPPLIGPLMIAMHLGSVSCGITNLSSFH